MIMKHISILYLSNDSKIPIWSRLPWPETPWPATQCNAITSTFNSAPLESSVRPRPRCSSKEQVPLDCPLSKDVKNLWRSLGVTRRIQRLTRGYNVVTIPEKQTNQHTSLHIYIYMIYTYSYQTCKLIRVPYESNTQCHVSKKRVQKTVPWSKSATHPIFIRTASTPGWLRRQYLKYFFLLRAILVWWLITAISYLRSLHMFRRPFRL